MKDKIYFIDIMSEKGSYIRTIKQRHNPLFPIDVEELREEIIKKLPTLKGINFKIFIQDETKHLIGTNDMPDGKYVWWK